MLRAISQLGVVLGVLSQFETVFSCCAEELLIIHDSITRHVINQPLQLPHSPLGFRQLPRQCLELPIASALRAVITTYWH